MENQRKIGTLVMVASVFLAICFFVLSSDACFVGQIDPSIPLGWIRYCFNLRFFPDGDSIYSEYAIDIPYKFLFLICALIFACGFLISKDVIKIPKKS